MNYNNQKNILIVLVDNAFQKTMLVLLVCITGNLTCVCFHSKLSSCYVHDTSPDTFFVHLSENTVALSPWDSYLRSLFLVGNIHEIKSSFLNNCIGIVAHPRFQLALMCIIFPEI